MSTQPQRKPHHKNHNKRKKTPGQSPRGPGQQNQKKKPRRTFKNAPTLSDIITGKLFYSYRV